MAYFVKAIGILFVAIGVSVFIRPILVKSMIDLAKVGKRCLFGGAVIISCLAQSLARLRLEKGLSVLRGR